MPTPARKAPAKKLPPVTNATRKPKAKPAPKAKKILPMKRKAAAKKK